MRSVTCVVQRAREVTAPTWWVALQAHHPQELVRRAENCSGTPRKALAPLLRVRGSVSSSFPSSGSEHGQWEDV